VNHRDHVELTFSFLRAQGFTKGSDAVFDHLRALDAAEGGRRFHATLSTVWPRLIAAHMRSRDDDFETFIERETVLVDKTLPLRFYSRERLFSDVSRGRFVEPDLCDLPRIAALSHGFYRGTPPGGARDRDAC
jgi:hypothetical protein